MVFFSQRKSNRRHRSLEEQKNTSATFQYTVPWTLMKYFSRPWKCSLRMLKQVIIIQMGYSTEGWSWFINISVIIHIYIMRENMILHLPKMTPHAIHNWTLDCHSLKDIKILPARSPRNTRKMEVREPRPPSGSNGWVDLYTFADVGWL